LSNAAFLARSHLLDTGDGTGNDLIKPTPTARNRRDERGVIRSLSAPTRVAHIRILPW